MGTDLLLGGAMLVAAFYVGWNIGANDAANCIGTTVGGQVLSYRSAALVMAVFVVLGGVMQGENVMTTVGKSIVITDAATFEMVNNRPAPAALEAHFPDARLPDAAILVAMLAAGLFVTLATVWRFPVSTSQAIVGGVAGTGIGIVGFSPGYFDTSVLLGILGSWVVSPVLALLLAATFYWLLGQLLRRARAHFWSNFLRAAVIASSAYVSYSLGANDVGNAIGPLINKYPDRITMLAILAGVAMATGALTFGRRVTRTVGHDITPLDYTGALAAQLAAGFGVHLFSILGMPVSTSQAVVGAVIGIGLTKGALAVSTRKVSTIVAGWIATPVCAALVAAGAYRFFIGWFPRGG
ncbi:MAG: inorganic phosphate transporter [Woeseiaceae bacterium]